MFSRDSLHDSLLTWTQIRCYLQIFSVFMSNFKSISGKKQLRLQNLAKQWIQSRVTLTNLKSVSADITTPLLKFEILYKWNSSSVKFDKCRELIHLAIWEDERHSVTYEEGKVRTTLRKHVKTGKRVVKKRNFQEKAFVSSIRHSFYN